MCRNWLGSIARCWFVGMVSMVLALQVSAAEESARDTVVRVTEQVMQVVDEKGSLMNDDPEAFLGAIRTVLDPVVAFDYIAAGVMGNYAKQASSEQRQRFSTAFQEGLVSTYAKGMSVYAKLDVKTLPSDDETEGRRASVTQIVVGDDGEHRVVYSMGKSKRDNQWKLLNVIIDGVNLGSTFRSQFSQAMKKHGDIDAVIENWST